MSEPDRTEAVVKTVVNVAAKVAAHAAGFHLAGNVTRLLEEPKSRGWDPVVPLDIHAKLPPVADDGTAECWRCKTRLPFGELEIGDKVYVCRPCTILSARVNPPYVATDLDHVTLRSKRWLVWPAAAAAVAIALVIVYVFR